MLVVAGIAGALYVPQVGIINPGEFEPGNSIEVVIWTAVGGRGTLIGPIIGAIAVNVGKSWFTSALPEFWLFALGALFVLVTLFLPRGLVGLWNQALSRRPMTKPAAPALAQAAELERWLVEDMGWRSLGLIPSPITGGDGNHEFLLGGRKP